MFDSCIMYVILKISNSGIGSFPGVKLYQVGNTDNEEFVILRTVFHQFAFAAILSCSTTQFAKKKAKKKKRKREKNVKKRERELARSCR